MTQKRFLLVPLGVFLISLICSLFIWRTISANEDELLKQKVQSEATLIQNELLNQMNSRISAMSRMAIRWEIQGGTPFEFWEKDASNYLKNPGYQAIEWVDSSYHVRWIVPLKGNEAAQNLDLTFEPKRAAALKKAKEDKEAMYSGVVDLVQGKKGMLVFFPLYVGENEKFDGFILAVFDIPALMNAALIEEITKGYEVKLLERGEEFYSRNVSDDVSDKWQHTLTIQFQNIKWDLQIRPDLATVQPQVSMDWILLGGGVFLSLLLTVIAYFVQLYNAKSLAVIENEKRLSAIVETTVDGIITISNMGVVESFNKACEKIFGYTADEVVGKNVKILMPEIDVNMHDSFLKHSQATDETEIIGIDLEIDGKKKDNTVFPMDLSMSEVTLHGRKLYSGILRDISERKNAEEEIRQAQHFQDLIMSNIPDLLFIKDEDFRIVKANPAFLNTYPEGVRDKVIGYTTLEEYDEKEAESFLYHDKLALTEGISETEETINFPDGKTRTLFTKKVRFENAGHPFVLGISRDITALKEAEADREEIRSAMENTVEGVSQIDPEGRYVYLNDAYASTCGYTPEELTGVNWAITVHEDDHEMMNAAYATMLETGKIAEEPRGVRKDGTLFYKRVTMISRYNDAGEFIGHHCFMSDISERKAAEVAVKQYSEELQRSNADLEQFAYIASHDLKAPLRGIQNLTEWIEENIKEYMDEETGGYIALLKGRVLRLEGLLAGLLQYSRAGHFGKNLATLDLDEMVAGIKDLQTTTELGFEVVHDLPKIVAPVVALDLILRNLIGNAIKHHDKSTGIIKVHCSAVEGGIELSVEDDGPGVPAEFSDRVFKMFQTLRPRDEVEGSGMGLAIVKKLVEQVGGRVWLDQTGNNVGLKVCMRLPYKVA